MNGPAIVIVASSFGSAICQRGIGRERQVRQRPIFDLVPERRRRDREHDERRDRAGQHRAQDRRLELAAPTARAVERSISIAMTTGIAASTVMIARRHLPESCRSVRR